MLPMQECAGVDKLRADDAQPRDNFVPPGESKSGFPTEGSEAACVAPAALEQLFAAPRCGQSVREPTISYVLPADEHVWHFRSPSRGGAPSAWPATEPAQTAPPYDSDHDRRRDESSDVSTCPANVPAALTSTPVTCTPEKVPRAWSNSRTGFEARRRTDERDEFPSPDRYDMNVVRHRGPVKLGRMCNQKENDDEPPIKLNHPTEQAIEPSAVELDIDRSAQQWPPHPRRWLLSRWLYQGRQHDSTDAISPRKSGKTLSRFWPSTSVSPHVCSAFCASLLRRGVVAVAFDSLCSSSALFELTPRSYVLQAQACENVVSVERRHSAALEKRAWRRGARSPDAYVMTKCLKTVPIDFARWYVGVSLHMSSTTLALNEAARLMEQCSKANGLIVAMPPEHVAAVSARLAKRMAHLTRKSQSVPQGARFAVRS